MKYLVTLATVASITAYVEADDEDTAHDKALTIAKGFSDEGRGGRNYSVDINDEWQLEDPTIEELP